MDTAIAIAVSCRNYVAAVDIYGVCIDTVVFCSQIYVSAGDLDGAATCTDTGIARRSDCSADYFNIFCTYRSATGAIYG